MPVGVTSGLASAGGAVVGNRKAVVVTFGGGARDDETFMPDGRENIPYLFRELVPQATFFTQVVNRGILGHYVANASLATGVYETINNFVAAPPQNPTIFEYFRRDLNRPSSDVWVIAPSVGFERIGQSGHSQYGPGLGANVVLPKRLLASAVPTSLRADYQTPLRDNYESPLYRPETGVLDIELERITGLLKLSVSDFLARARNLESPDELFGLHCKQAHAPVRSESLVDHVARHRYRPRRHLLALRRRHPPNRSPVRRDLAADSE